MDDDSVYGMESCKPIGTGVELLGSPDDVGMYYFDERGVETVGGRASRVVYLMQLCREGPFWIGDVD